MQEGPFHPLPWQPPMQALPAQQALAQVQAQAQALVGGLVAGQAQANAQGQGQADAQADGQAQAPQPQPPQAQQPPPPPILHLHGQPVHPQFQGLLDQWAAMVDPPAAPAPAAAAVDVMPEEAAPGNAPLDVDEGADVFPELEFVQEFIAFEGEEPFEDFFPLDHIH